MSPADLVARWKADAERFAEYGSPLADVCRLHAAELEAALAQAEDELLSPAAAAEYAGVSERTLRSRRADGKLDNHGTDTRPLYRRGDLPHAPSARDDFDARAAAARLAS